MAKFYRKTKSPTILTLSKAGAEFGPEALLDAIYVNYQATPDCSPSGDTKIVCEDAGAKEDLMMHLDALVGEFGIDGQKQNAPRQRTRAAKKLESEARAKRENKYDYLYIVQGRYGDTYQWEDLAGAKDPRAAEILYAAHAGRHGRSQRTIQRRVLREDSGRLLGRLSDPSRKW